MFQRNLTQQQAPASWQSGIGVLLLSGLSLFSGCSSESKPEPEATQTKVTSFEPEEAKLSVQQQIEFAGVAKAMKDLWGVSDATASLVQKTIYPLTLQEKQISFFQNEEHAQKFNALRERYSICFYKKENDEVSYLEKPTIEHLIFNQETIQQMVNRFGELMDEDHSKLLGMMQAVLKSDGCPAGKIDLNDFARFVGSGGALRPDRAIAALEVLKSRYGLELDPESSIINFEMDRSCIALLDSTQCEEAVAALSSIGFPMNDPAFFADFTRQLVPQPLMIELIREPAFAALVASTMAKMQIDESVLKHSAFLMEMVSLYELVRPASELLPEQWEAMKAAYSIGSQEIDSERPRLNETSLLKALQPKYPPTAPKNGWNQLSAAYIAAHEMEPSAFRHICRSLESGQEEICMNDLVFLSYLSARPELRTLVCSRDKMMLELLHTYARQPAIRTEFGGEKASYLERPPLEDIPSLQLARAVVLTRALNDPEVLQEIGEIIFEDIYGQEGEDASNSASERGGVVRMGGRIQFKAWPSNGCSNVAYNYRKTDLMDGMADFHLHAPGINMAPFAGPSGTIFGGGDLGNAHATRAAGVVITAVGHPVDADGQVMESQICFNVDLYFSMRDKLGSFSARSIDLGIYRAPFTRKKD